ncbi:MAG: protein arginine kinase [Caldicoprobacterales bacterium]|jgi:protein arginine kinase
MSWINESGPARDVVLTSRIRIARNIAAVPFPSIMQPHHAAEVAEKVKKSLYNKKAEAGSTFAFMYIRDVPAVERQILVEKHLASQDLMESYETSALLLDSKEKIAVMINEEDHIRMQCILPGFQLNQAWEKLNRVDDMIEADLEYAFHEQLGYLTCCPTNVGTGMRSSVMMHLPALTVNKQMNAILHTISKIGLTARGIYGEGSEAAGSIYQISNQITLGPSEEELINNLTITCRQIIEKERIARKALHKTTGIQFDDAVWRAYGVLRNARTLDIKEFMAYISQLRLGVSMGLIPGFSLEDVDSLMTAGQPAGVMKKTGQIIQGRDIDEARATVIRDAVDEILESRKNRKEG